MNMKQMKQKLSLILCMVLIAAMALFTTACNDKKMADTTAGTEIVTIQDGDELGEGKTEFTFSVTDTDGGEISATIHTDETTVGAALLNLGLIDGEEGEYGLYIKTVNGITVDYDTDGKYWAFYVDGEYGMTGVDSTDIVAGSTYAFKVE